MVNEEGKEVTNRRSISDVFADFYADLYCSKRPIIFDCTDDGIPLPPFTRKEVSPGLKDLKNNRCKDKAGIVAEMLKQAGTVLVDMLCETFNEILRNDARPPSSWKRQSSKFYTSLETHECRKTTGRSQLFPYFINFLQDSCIED